MEREKKAIQKSTNDRRKEKRRPLVFTFVLCSWWKSEKVSDRMNWSYMHYFIVKDIV